MDAAGCRHLMKGLNINGRGSISDSKRHRIVTSTPVIAKCGHGIVMYFALLSDTVKKGIFYKG